MGFISKQIEGAYKKILFSRHDPDDRVYYFSQGDFPSLRAHEYEFKNKHGDLLKGKFYHYLNPKPEKLIVFDHGVAPGYRSYMREIETLCRHGYLVYAFDHTGCRDSEGENIRGLTGSLSDLDDCLSALGRIEQLKSFDIMVIGHSRGGFSALNILAFHPEVKKIVAMSGFISLETMQKQITPFILAPFRKRLFELERECNPDYVNVSAIKTLGGCDNPAMIVHSKDDATVSSKANFDRLKSALAGRDNTEFLLMTDRDHNPTFTKEAVDYKNQFTKDLVKQKKREKKNPDLIDYSFIARYDWNKMTEQDMGVWNKIFAFLDK